MRMPAMRWHVPLLPCLPVFATAGAVGTIAAADMALRRFAVILPALRMRLHQQDTTAVQAKAESFFSLEKQAGGRNIAVRPDPSPCGPAFRQNGGQSRRIYKNTRASAIFTSHRTQQRGGGLCGELAAQGDVQVVPTVAAMQVKVLFHGSSLCTVC